MLKQAVRAARDAVLSARRAPSPEGATVQYLNTFDGYFHGRSFADDPERWWNPTHLTEGHWEPYGYWIAEQVAPQLATGPILWVGDSWSGETIKAFESRLLELGLTDRPITPAWKPGRRLVDLLGTLRRELKARPRTVVLQYGTNEAASHRPIEAVTADTLKAIGMCRAAGARVVITGPPPIATDYDASVELNETLKVAVAGFA